MEQHIPQYLESRIMLDEEDWGIRFGALQLAHSIGLEQWDSSDGAYHYKLHSGGGEFSSIPVYDSVNDMPASIPDPEYVSDLFELINPTVWSIVRTIKSEFDQAVAHVPVRRRGFYNPPLPTFSEITHYTINERTRSCTVIRTKGSLDIVYSSDNPDFQEIAELCRALDDLHLTLRQLIR